MKVKCRDCGAINEKERNDYSVKCPTCGTVTLYWVHPKVKEEI